MYVRVYILIYTCAHVRVCVFSWQSRGNLLFILYMRGVWDGTDTKLLGDRPPTPRSSGLHPTSKHPRISPGSHPPRLLLLLLCLLLLQTRTLSLTKEWRPARSRDTDNGPATDPLIVLTNLCHREKTWVPTSSSPTYRKEKDKEDKYKSSNLGAQRHRCCASSRDVWTWCLPSGGCTWIRQDLRHKTTPFVLLLLFSHSLSFSASTSSPFFFFSSLSSFVYEMVKFVTTTTRTLLCPFAIGVVGTPSSEHYDKSLLSFILLPMV